MNKRGQLAIIEFKYFIVGFLIGLIGGLALVFLGTKKIVPFQIPAICGSIFLNKKGQLGGIEFKFFMIGLAIGFVISLILVFLGSSGILPFTIPVCPVAAE